MDIEDYERERAEKKLLMKLQEAEEAVKDGEGWLDFVNGGSPIIKIRKE